MRTTIDIPDDLAIEAKKAAVERRTTLRELVIQGLRSALVSGPPVKPADPMDRLEGLGKGLWQGVDADAYVREQRQGWE